MRQVNRLFVILFIAVMLPLRLFSFEEYWRFGVDAKIIGSGGVAYSSSCFNDAAIYWNSAGLAKIDNFSFSLMYYNLYNQDIHYRTLTLAKKMGYTTLGFGVYQMNTEKMEKYEADGLMDNGIPKPVNTGSFSLNNRVFSFAMSRELSDFLLLGLVYNTYITEVDIYKIKGYTADVGVIITVNKKINLGLNMRNVYAKKVYYTPESEPMIYPKKYEMSVGIKDLLPVNLYVGALYSALDKKISPAVGMNYSLEHFFSVLGAYDFQNVYIGFDFFLKKVDIVYTLRTNWYLGMTHIISIKYKM